MRCKEQLESLPFTSDHLWQTNERSALPVGGCVNCGITPDEWENTFGKRLKELGEVGTAVFKQYVKIDVIP